MIKINRHHLLRRLLVATTLRLGLLAAGAISAHAGVVTVTGANGANGVDPNPAAAGGGAAAATATTAMFPIDASNTATATGGNGGMGGKSSKFCLHNGPCIVHLGTGGPGGAATSTATTSISTGSRVSAATATSDGGAGGQGGGIIPYSNSPGGNGGNGGNASSSATSSNTNGSASATATSDGGTGESGGAGFPWGYPGLGGVANATSSASGSGGGAVTSGAIAYGGAGGCCGGAGGGGGNATALASSSSTGDGVITSGASAFGGGSPHAGAVGGNATATSSGLSRSGGEVDATASATGGGGGGSGGAALSNATAIGATLTGSIQANATATGGAAVAPGTASAKSDAKNPRGEVLATASALSGGVWTSPSASTNAEVGSVALTPAKITAGRAVSNAILSSKGLDVGVGAMAAAYGGSGPAVTYEATATFDFSTSIEALDLVLSDNFAVDSAGISFDSMELLVVHETTQIEKTFSSLAGAEAYFTAHPIIGLGAIASGQSVEIEYMLGYNADTSAAPGDGFGFTYDLVDPSPSAAVPESSTWAMLIMGFVGLGVAQLAAWQRPKSPPRLAR